MKTGKPINLLELFSGIGGFTKGFEDAGYRIDRHYFSEIDKHAIANYKYNFPNAEHIGSVTDIPNGSLRGIDVITFGSPCQDFSLAGKRKGLEGARSSLIGEAIRLISDIRPSVFIWENVKGAFSSNSGADFWAILQAFANIGGCRLEWQLLNTLWFLPQNRERIYLVGHLAADGRDFRPVFPINENNCGINERTGETRSIRTLTAGGNSGGLHSSMTLVISQRGRGNSKGGTFNECPTITSNSFQHNNHVNNIRRLTEIECERLQGFPDDWTKYGDYDGVVKEVPMSQRYKMLGNAITVRVVEEIAKRLRDKPHIAARRAQRSRQI